MQYRILGETGLKVSRIAFGCGPLSGNLTGDDYSNQLASVRRALELGINWFDTARTYGAGRSELNLGRCFAELGIADEVMVATKVRVLPEHLSDIPAGVRRSVEQSLKALRRQQITLVQVHNAITNQRGSQPTSLSVADMTGENGVLSTLEQLQREGVIGQVGLTATGDADAVEQVLATGRVSSLQVPFSATNISAGYEVSDHRDEADEAGWHHHGAIMRYGQSSGVGVFAIRVFAGGALLLRKPSPYTYQTKFFPLSLYERDRQLASRLEEMFPEVPLAELCLRFVLSHGLVDSAIVGFGQQQHVEQAVSVLELGALLQEELRQIQGNALRVL